MRDPKRIEPMLEALRAPRVVTPEQAERHRQRERARYAAQKENAHV